MELLLVGVSHETAPLEVRERLAIGSGDIPESLTTLRSFVDGAVILSTCNRTEVYCSVDGSGDSSVAVKSFWASYSHLSIESIDPFLYVQGGQDVARHLFKVASGVKSMIVGESEILGQVREAYSDALEHGLLPSGLSHLFHHALRVGRKARRETDIGRGAVSVSAVAIELARRVHGDLHSARVLVIGAGETGRLTAKQFKRRGVGMIGVANRTYDRAVDVAMEVGGEAIPFERLVGAIESFDIVVSATEASQYVLTAETVREALGSDGTRRIVFIDLAVPRDIESKVGEISGVTLRDVDDLDSLAKDNQKERLDAVEIVEGIVENEVQKFARWLSSAQAISTVKGIEKNAEDIRVKELRKTLKYLPELSVDGRKRIEALTRSIVGKILHFPVTNLKMRDGTTSHIEAARELFELDRTAYEHETDDADNR